MSTDAAAVRPRTAGQGYLPPSLIDRPEVRADRTLRAFLSVLAHYARGFKDTCYPSVARLAHDLGCCPGHVRRQIRKARALGLIALVGVAWNRCRRVFKLTWKPDLGVDPRDRTGGHPLPERPETAPYPSAQRRRLTRAPKRAQGCSKEQNKNAACGVAAQEGPTTPAATEAEPEAPLTREATLAAIAAGRALISVASPSPRPVSPLASLSGALGPRVDVERRKAELLAQLAARKAQTAPQAAPVAVPDPAPESSNPAAAPRGWVGRLFGRS